MEFGAKLSLKDTMYATLQKNLKMQKQFTEQVKQTSANVKSLAKQKIAPVIKAKDQATKTIDRVKSTLKTVGKTVAKPFIAVKDGASKILGGIKNTLKSIGSTVAKATVAIKDVASAGLGKIKSVLSTLAKGVTIAVGIAGAGASLIAGNALSEGANLQQSIGGIETLFKGDAGTVKANADMAFKTAGLSANAYMEQVTSFSASLLNSLGGDTAKSAQVADMAIIDMADNANKMGTSMEMIQNAYSGFARGNYTMLDNLKLGYSGSQEEMQRLLDDASALSGVEYDMSNLSDVYNAIHVIQEKMGIAGTTSKEASETFTGSLSAVKSAFSNLMGNMAIGGDVTGSMEQLVDSAITFLVNNAIPMLGNVFTALPKAIKTAIAKVAPQIKENGGAILQSIKDGFIGMLPSSMQGIATNLLGSLGRIFNSITSTISNVAPKIKESLGGMFGEGGGFLDGLTSAIETIIPILGELAVHVVSVVAQVAPVLSQLGGMFMSVFPSIMGIVQSVVGVFQSIFPVARDIIVQVIEVVMPKVQAIAGLIQKVMPTIGAIIQGVLSAISTIFPVAWSIISPIIDVAITVIGAIFDVVNAVFPAIQSIVSSVWKFLEPIFTAIGKGVKIVGEAVGGIAEFLGKGASTVAGWFGFAYGKDRVPHDNYPAMLHAGEKVLTRNQADQYDRVMSRGVSLTQPVASAPTSSSTSSGASMINIDRLADTVVIHEEADVDSVVERMVTKFRQLVPNMA